MTLEEEMAVAVLKGDKAAALALADRLQENRAAGMVTIKSLKQHIGEYDKGQIRVAVIYPLEPAYAEIDWRGVEAAVKKWIEDDTPLVINGNPRIEVYILPKPSIK
jgi:hypothetical protein